MEPHHDPDDAQPILPLARRRRPRLRPGRPAQLRLTIDPDGQDVGTAYVVAPIEGDLAPGTYTLVPEGSGDPGLATVFERRGRTFVGVVAPGLEGASRTFTLEPGTPDDRPTVRIKPGPDREFTVTLGDEVLTQLVQGERKPYLYPVNGPTGAPITRAYPMEEDVEGEDQDHPHQRSFWFTHGNVNGYDFWAADPKNGDNPKFGTIRQTGAAVVAEGAVGILRTTDDWLGPDGEPVCDDVRRFTFYAGANPRILDVDVTIRASHGPVTFGDTKEGMFGLRLASSMDVKRKQGGKITNAEGITDTDAWGKPSPWVDYTGPVQGQTVGVAILNHPSSFRYPTTWHVRDYGLFAANPFGYGDFKTVAREGAHTLPEGESMRFRYRVILHKGTTDKADIAGAFDAYEHAPKVTLTAK